MIDYYETPRQLIDLSDIKFSGRILDIGGGGEGIISLHSGERVVAIDKRADELAETADIGTKIIMDACSLCFLDDYFDNITCFYTLMYMDKHQIEEFLKEAYRVSKKNGILWIWDAVIPSRIPSTNIDVFVAQLEVKLSESKAITTGYGVRWNQCQSLSTIKELCEKAGFVFEDGGESGESIWLCLRK